MYALEMIYKCEPARAAILSCGHTRTHVCVWQVHKWMQKTSAELAASCSVVRVSPAGIEAQKPHGRHGCSKEYGDHLDSASINNMWGVLMIPPEEHRSPSFFVLLWMTIASALVPCWQWMLCRYVDWCITTQTMHEATSWKSVSAHTFL